MTDTEQATMESLSVAELESFLGNKKRKLKSLQKKREKLLAQIDEINDEIDEIQGFEDGTGRTGPRPKNEKPLRDFVTDVLSRHKKGLPLAKLADKVKAAGYKSKSVNFSNTVYQCVYKEEQFVRDENSGNWTLSQSS